MFTKRRKLDLISKKPDRMTIREWVDYTKTREKAIVIEARIQKEKLEKLSCVVEITRINTAK